MKEKLLEQMAKELKLAVWVDVVTAVVAIMVTLAFFAIAAGAAAGTVTQMPDLSKLGGMLGGMLGGNLFGAAAQAKGPDFNTAATIIMFVAIIITFILNWYAIRALQSNKAKRAKISEGIAKLLADEAVSQYNDGSILKAYETRYNLLTVIMGSVMALSIIVPLVIFINNLTKF
jgi:hypothetical protein